jgi:hypothetical protein
MKKGRQEKWKKIPRHGAIKGQVCEIRDSALWLWNASVDWGFSATSAPLIAHQLVSPSAPRDRALSHASRRAYMRTMTDISARIQAQEVVKYEQQRGGDKGTQYFL